MSYAYIMDAFQSFYSGTDTRPDPVRQPHVAADYACVYWGMIFCNCAAAVAAVFPRHAAEAMLLLTIVAVGSIVGMWLERFNIVDDEPARARICHPPGAVTCRTIWDWAVFGGTVGLFLTGFLLALRLVPIVSMYEMRELLARKGQP